MLFHVSCNDDADVDDVDREGNTEVTKELYELSLNSSRTYPAFPLFTVATPFLLFFCFIMAANEEHKANEATTNSSLTDSWSEGFLWRGKQTLKVPVTMFNENRQKLAERMRARLEGRGEHAIVLLQGGESQMRHCTDHEDVFRQESYFSYLFGVIEPGFYGAVDVSVQPARSFLFMPHLPDSYAVWMGPLHTRQQIKDKYGVDEVHYIEDMAAVLKAAAGSGGSLPTLFLLKGINTDSGNSCKPAQYDGVDAFPQDLKVLHPELSECRVIKSEEEIRVMRYAAAVSSDAHVEVMRRVRAGMMEYEMEADFLHHAAVAGGCRLAGYTCICGTGPNCSILHYGHAGTPNDRECKDGDMALLDMGAEYFTYGADITCSFPVWPTHALPCHAMLN
ncbi:unnamed protein product [Closterium sp. NIES-53]